MCYAKNVSSCLSRARLYWQRCLLVKAILLACIVGNVLINVLAVEILYQSHVSVAGVHARVSVHPINGTITAVSPTTNNDTIDDRDVRRFYQYFVL